VTDEPGRAFKVYSALDDGGAEVAVARSSTIAELNNVQLVGNIKLRGIVGASVNAALVKLYVSIDNSDCTNDCVKHWLPIVCAVCDEANDDLVLTADQVEQLTAHAALCSSVTSVDRPNSDCLSVFDGIAVDTDDGSDEQVGDGSNNDVHVVTNPPDPTTNRKTLTLKVHREMTEYRVLQ
jgi:hypothetical protein